MEKGVNSVHGSWTTALVGSPWAKDRVMAGSYLELLLSANFGHGGST
jgi:hypothetical protein